MAALLHDVGTAANNTVMQQRIAAALGVAATSVYSEASIASTNASSAFGSKVITVNAPAWVGVGCGIANLTGGTGSIPNGVVITAVNGTATITISAPIGSLGVANGDTISFLQHTNRAAFANRVSAGNYSIVHVCYAVLANVTIANELNLNTTPDYAIPDADIQFAVNSIFNLLAGT